MSSAASMEAVRSILPRDLVVVIASGSARGRRLRLQGRARISQHPTADLVVPELGNRELEVTRSAIAVTCTNPLTGEFLAEVPDDGRTLGTLQVLTVNGCFIHLRAELDYRHVTPSDSAQFAELVGPSAAMRALFGVLERVVDTEARVLVEGEPGSGKSTVARALHAKSHRQSGPLVLVDCSSASCDLLEEELFGTTEGSGQLGAFQLARGGTLILADVDDLPLSLGAKLASAIRSQAHVRVISTARRSLQLEVERGKFNQELFLELATVSVSIPPLRSHRDDIPALVAHFLDEARKLGADTPELSPAEMAALCHHDWPGNVAELASVVGRFVDSHPDHALPMPAPLSHDGSDPVPAFDASTTFRETRGIFEHNFERRYIRWLLLRHKGNISAAAREAKMDRKHLYDLARRHGLRGERPSSVPPSSRS